MTTTLADLIAKDTCSARLAKFLIDRREQWIDGRLLATVGGAYAWRTRLSELRKAPWYLDVENRVRTVADGTRSYRISEYRLRTAA